jgi:hypothetical protein
VADRVTADPRQAPAGPGRAEVELDHVAFQGDVGGASARQIVDDVHAPALCGQSMGERADDESGAAGHERAGHHRVPQNTAIALRTGDGRGSAPFESRAHRTRPPAPLAGPEARARTGSLISGSHGDLQRRPVVDIRALHALGRAKRLQASVKDDHDALADVQCRQSMGDHKQGQLASQAKE